MSKTPTDPFEKRHLQLLGAVEREIQKVYQHLHLSVGVMMDGHDFSNTDPEQFALINHPLLYHQIDRLTTQATKQVTAILRRAVMNSYLISTDKAQELVDKYLAGEEKRLTAQLLRRAEGATTFAGQWFDKHPISERVWNIVEGFKQEMEERIKEDLINGTPADQISRNIRSYLNEPHKRFRRIKGKDGTLRLSKPAQAYHPGRGVYRSSYKNARRLAVTEVNNAYRQADNDRWQKLDFVVGIRVQLSNNHTYRDHKGRLRTLVDICDDLKGDYPKDFQFTSWHPHCRCIATPILKTREEMKLDRQLIREGKAPAPSKNEVKELPQNFKTWQAKNAKRIAKATERGKLPHWYRDNDGLINYHNYNPKQWEKTAYYQKSGGYLVRDRARVQKGRINSNEAKKLAKETRMATTFAKAGYKVEMIKEVTRVPSPDVLIDGVKAELKSVESYKKIVKHAKKAIGKQKAEIVLFEFEKETTEVYKELLKLKRENIKAMYYFKDKNDIHTL